MCSFLGKYSDVMDSWLIFVSQCWAGKRYSIGMRNCYQADSTYLLRIMWHR